jgi:hypothetical protein
MVRASCPPISRIIAILHTYDTKKPNTRCATTLALYIRIGK